MFNSQGTHRDQANFGRAKWRKTVLLPCWAAQVALLCSLMGLFSYRLSNTVTTWKDEEDKGQVPMVEFIWESANVGFSFISLILTFISIAKFISETLTPSGMLFNNVLNSVFALAIMALDILVYVQHADKRYSLIGLIIDSSLLLFTIIPVIYAIVVYQRLSAYDDYHLPGNIKPYGYDATTEVTEYPSMTSPPEPYDPTNPNPAGQTRQRSHSALSATSLRLSFSARPSSPVQPQTQQRQEGNTRPTDLERRASYDHRRSTRFDEYVAARRQSAGAASLRASVEHALDSGFGWEEDQVIKPKDSFISAGTVAASRPRGSSNPLGRQPSVEASLSAVSTSTTAHNHGEAESVTTSTTPTRESSLNSGVTVPHSLVSVPEAHEEEDASHNQHYKQYQFPETSPSYFAQQRGSAGLKMGLVDISPEDRQALLSHHNRSDSGGSGRNSRRQSRSPPNGGSRSASRMEELGGLEEVELENGRRRREGP